MSRGAALTLVAIGGLLCLFGLIGMLVGLPMVFAGLMITAKRSLNL